MNFNFKKIATAVSATAAVLSLSAAFSITAEALDAPVITAQTEAASSYVTFQWNPVNGASKYVTRYSFDNGVTWYDAGNAYGTDDSIFDLNAGGSYLVQVAAYDGEQGAWSAPFEVVTIPDHSNISTSTTGFQTKATKNSATFSWGEAPGATGYHIYTESNGQYILLGTAPTNSFEVGNLTPDTAYRFYVSPYKQSVSGYVAEYTSFIPYVDVTTLAKKPTISYDASAEKFVLPATNADGYLLRFYNEKGKLITEKYTNAYNFTTSNVYPSSAVIKYGAYRKVKAYSYLEINGKKVYSAGASKAYIIQPKPSLKQKTGKLSISWKKVPKATKYEVYVSYNLTSGYRKVATLSNKKTSYTLKKFRGTKISTAKTYYVYVKPVAKGATSICSTSWYLY